MAHIPALKPAGTLLFWVCLSLMVTTLQSLLPNGQKHTVRQTTSTPPTAVLTTTNTTADLGHGERKIYGCGEKAICEDYCSICVNNHWSTQECYENLVDWCLYVFHKDMDSINSTDWCSLEKVKSAYNNFTLCTETIADCLLLPWPNQFVEGQFVAIHSNYFQTCPTEALRDPPPSIVLALVMTPICLIPVMVVLVVFKTKNGDRRS
nr:receptor activity-modifying protein 2 isoform X1 [Misgurnus anguillicaudatus]